MGSAKKKLYNFRILGCLLIAVFIVSGWSFGTDSNTDLPIFAGTSDFFLNGNIGNSVYATDYGTNNNKIYIGISSYIYGETKYGKEVNPLRAVKSTINGRLEGVKFINNPIDGSVEETVNALYKNWNSAVKGIHGEKNGKKYFKKLNLEPVSTVKFIIKVTRFVKLSIKSKGGKKTYDISRGKLTQGLYSFQVDKTNISRSIYYYKLETDDGTVTKKWFC